MIIKDDVVCNPEQYLAQLGLGDFRFSKYADFDEAVSLSVEGIAYANMDGCHVIFDPTLFFNLEPDINKNNTGFVTNAIDSNISNSSINGVCFLLEGSSGTYGFTQYINGHVIRSILLQDDEIVYDEGSPLPYEQKLLDANDGDYEQYILELVQTLSISFIKLQSQQFHVYRNVQH
jgi:hypothetical protein